MFHMKTALSKVLCQQLNKNPLPLLPAVTNKSSFHTTGSNHKTEAEKVSEKFMRHNDVVFPPQQEGEEKRPAFVCHFKDKIKYSPEKMWYVACLVRGMSIDQALIQLGYVGKKGAPFIRDTILEAQELAVKEHNVEFKSNLWIAESFAHKDLVIRGLRRHARHRMYKLDYKYCTYFVRLEEGKPPKNYYYAGLQTAPEKLEEWLTTVRRRKISSSL
uniref:Large ribosomal subunit protein uL22m n=1 Tax=Cacopsylla melanoneura TaxID=428564 RepID=A0A8D8RAF9_9HEMI